jgi:hypothetical protein
MAQLADAIATINTRELDANEQAIASCFPRPPELPPDAQQHLAPFLEWCTAQRVRPLPARPASVAAFLQHQRDRGVSKETISATLAAIEGMHTAANWGSPIASPLVRITTAASTIEAPRSWAKEEKQLFMQLPVEIQSVVARREREREKVLRQSQNSTAEYRKLLRLQQADAETSAAEPKKENEHGKDS